MDISKKALYVAFEGVEGSGKSTLLEEVRKDLELKGYKVFTVREPGTTELAEKIREMILSYEIDIKTELMLFMSSRFDLINKVIKKVIGEGKYDFIISDRSLYSSVVYQGYCGGIGLEKVLRLHEVLMDITPDIAIFLDIHPKKSVKRKDKKQINKFELKENTYHNKVYEGYKILADMGVIDIVNADRSLKEIKEDVENNILCKYKEVILQGI